MSMLFCFLPLLLTLPNEEDIFFWKEKVPWFSDRMLYHLEGGVSLLLLNLVFFLGSCKTIFLTVRIAFLEGLDLTF